MAKLTHCPYCRTDFWEPEDEIYSGLRQRIKELEDLHYKNQPYPEDHNYPEPTHSKPKPHTCGECMKPFYRSDYGLCRSHPVVRKGCQPIAIWREHEACENFKGEA